jgi:hypothetical protein
MTREASRPLATVGANTATSWLASPPVAAAAPATLSARLDRPHSVRPSAASNAVSAVTFATTSSGPS